jgi:hypothetical protein
MDDWFMFLNRGLAYTGVGNSDSHGILGDEPGYPRTFVWVGEGKDVQGKFTTRDVVDGLFAHRAVISMGPMIHFTVNDEPVGGTVAAAAGKATLRIRVESPNFAPVTQVKVFANGEQRLTIDVPEDEAHAFETERMVDVDVDTWFVVEVVGRQNLFPVVSPLEFLPLDASVVFGALLAGIDDTLLNPYGNVRPATTFFVTPLAFTNPIWVDTDGDGAFDAPLDDPRKKVPHVHAAPAADDVREQFRRLPEVP